MEVLHLVNGEYYAGAERVQDHILNYFKNDENIRCGVVTYKRGVFLDQAEIPDDAVLFKELSFRPFRLAKIINRSSIDIVHCHSPITLLMASCSLPFIKNRPSFIYHVHSPVMEDTENRFRNTVKYFLERIAVGVLKPLVVGVSQSVLDRSGYLSKYENRCVVENGTPQLVCRSKCIRAVDGQYNLVFAGLIRPRKGLDVLLSALALIDSDLRYKIKLHIYGVFDSVEYETFILDKIKALKLIDVVEFKGFVKDIPKAISSGEIFIIPSLYGEGLPMVLLEAMSVGSLIVASDVGGIKEILEEGRSGITFNVGDPDSLRKALEYVFNFPDDVALYQNNAVSQHASQYSVASMGHKLGDIYKGN